MNFYMLLLPISCMGSELLDPYLTKCQTQHSNKSVGYQLLNGHSRAGV